MSLIDVAAMALHNLWSRMSRTVLNIFGVVLACVVLAMMLAGTRGVSQGMDRMINESDTIRRFAIYGSWQRDTDVPDEAIRIDGAMSEARRLRLQKYLEAKWRRENSNRVQLDPENFEKLRALPQITELIPQSRLACSVKIDDNSQDGTIRTADRSSQQKLIFGEVVETSDDHGVMLGEYAAFRLGFVSDVELQQLIGRTLEVSVKLNEKRASQLKRLIESDLASLTKEGESLIAMKRLVDAVDMTSLNDRDKALLRSVFSINDEVQANSSEDAFRESFTVRGIIRGSNEDEGLSIFGFGGSYSGADIYLSPDRAMQIEMMKDGFTSFQGATGIVDEVQNLESLTKKIEALGFDTRSSWWLVKRIDEEIGKARLAIGALSLLILVISAVGISNTMVVSVLERTREFGILKATGAQDRNILQLMLMEGALTGLIGSIVALLISFTLAQLIAVFVNKYISGRIGEQFDASVFDFTSFDALLVVLLAVIVCTVAAIFPAWRAAKLDPVVAMRGR